MALCLNESQAEAIQAQNRMDSVAKTREAAEILAAKDEGPNDDHYYLQIADQKGKPIDLPDEERKVSNTLSLEFSSIYWANYRRRI